MDSKRDKKNTGQHGAGQNGGRGMGRGKGNRQACNTDGQTDRPGGGPDGKCRRSGGQGRGLGQKGQCGRTK